MNKNWWKRIPWVWGFDDIIYPFCLKHCRSKCVRNSYFSRLNKISFIDSSAKNGWSITLAPDTVTVVSPRRLNCTLRCTLWHILYYYIIYKFFLLLSMKLCVHYYRARTVYVRLRDFKQKAKNRTRGDTTFESCFFLGLKTFYTLPFRENFLNLLNELLSNSMYLRGFRNSWNSVNLLQIETWPKYNNGFYWIESWMNL